MTSSRWMACTALLAFGIASASSRALAAEPRDASAAAAAQKLFEEGRALMIEGRSAEACPKLAASQRLDPGAGTLLNLGECYEKTDKLASAWATYREAETLAQRSGQRERATHCAARARALFEKLSDLTIVAPPSLKSSPIQGLTIRRNGDAVPEVALGTAVPVDGGTHVVEVSAPGYRTWKGEVQIKVSGDHSRLQIPDLVKQPDASKPAPNPSTPPSRADEPSSISRTLGWVAVGVGSAGIVTGLVFGAIANSKNNEANSNGHCNDVDCDADGISLTRDAKNAARISTIASIAGAAIAVTGVVLVLTAPSSSATTTRTSAALRVRDGGLALGLDVHW